MNSIIKNSEQKTIPNTRPLRTAFIRVSAVNHITKENEELGTKEGSVVEYTLEDIMGVINEWQKTKKFYYFIIEHNDNEENKHWHIVLLFPDNSSCTFKTLKNKFPYGHIDTCRSGVKNCVRYLVHADNPEKIQYEWTDIITNSPDKLEKYKIQGNTSIDAETKIIIEKIHNGEIKQFQINQIPLNIFLKKRRLIENAFYYREQTLLTDPNRNIEVYVLQGSPRVGKTTFVKEWAKKNGKSVCFSSASRDPWQDYGGQDIFVYDDFDYNSIKIDDFKKALDPYTNTSMSRRYRNTLFTGDTIFICTNIWIGSWFPYDEEISREAVFKRINYVLDFKKYEDLIQDPRLSLLDDWEIPQLSDDASYYTVNKIVPSGDFAEARGRLGQVVNRYMLVRLEPIDKKIRKFELSKHVDITSDEVKRDNFLKKLDEI